MRESMEIYPRTAAERAMKLQEVLLRATSGKIKWWQAAELIGISARQLRRRRKRYEEEGYQGLLDRRFCERLGVKLPGATLPTRTRKIHDLVVVIAWVSCL
jgi:DNA-binding Lrp family transcriptional regulator